MGGNGRDPAGVIRRLIDFGPDEGTMGPLATPWDTLRAVALAAGTSEAGEANRVGDPFSEADRYVLDYLFEYGESGRQALLDDRGDMSAGYIDKALKNLRERGLIERVNGGKQGMKALYDLTEEGGKGTRENF